MKTNPNQTRTNERLQDLPIWLARSLPFWRQNVAELDLNRSPDTSLLRLNKMERRPQTSCSSSRWMRMRRRRPTNWSLWFHFDSARWDESGQVESKTKLGSSFKSISAHFVLLFVFLQLIRLSSSSPSITCLDKLTCSITWFELPLPTS